MTTQAERIVKSAESFLGTPFRHQGKLKGVGIDCVNFVAEVAKEAGVKDVDIPNDYKPREDGAVMMQLLKKRMKHVPIEKIKAGDVLALCDEALREPDIPRHLVIVKDVTPDAIFIIHAAATGVKSHRLNTMWKQRIHSAWRVHLEGVAEVADEADYQEDANNKEPKSKKPIAKKKSIKKT